MYLEIWQLIVLIVVLGFWGEYRYFSGWSKGMDEAMATFKDAARKVMMNFTAEHTITVSRKLMDELMDRGLIEKSADGKLIGKDNRTLDIDAEIEAWKKENLA